MGLRCSSANFFAHLTAWNDRFSPAVSNFSPKLLTVIPTVRRDIYLLGDMRYNTHNSFVVAFSAVSNLKALNLPLRVAKGRYFAGLEFAGFGNFPAPFLPTEWWHQCEQSLGTGFHSASFERACRIPLLFSRLCSVGEPWISADIHQGVIPIDSPFLTRRVSPQNIPCLVF